MFASSPTYPRWRQFEAGALPAFDETVKHIPVDTSGKSGA